MAAEHVSEMLYTDNLRTKQLLSRSSACFNRCQVDYNWYDEFRFSGALFT